MKKNLYLFITSLSFIAFNANAQTPGFNWAKKTGSTGVDYGYSIAIKNGNLYTTGIFTGTVDFDPSGNTTNLTADSTDIFVSKFDTAGNFIWARKMGGPTSKDVGYSVAVDANENVYVTGVFKGTANFNPGGTALNLTSAGGLDIFVAKFDASGTLQWAKAMGGSKDDCGYSIAVDANGDVYTTGWFLNQCNFNPSGTATNLTAAGTNATFQQFPWDAFITKHSTSGALSWVKQLGGTGYEFGASIVLDANKNIFLTGMFTGSADFDPSGSTSNLSSAGGGDIYVAKYDPNGAYVWAKKMGGGGDDWGNSIALDGSGNVLTTGVFQATSDFDPSGSTANLTATGANNVYDIFISKLDGSGTYIWAKAMGGDDDDTGLGITTDASGNVYTTGGFKNTSDFDPNGGTDNHTALGGTGLFDNFIQKLASNGDYLWTFQFGGTSDDGANSIIVDATNSIYTTGGFKVTADFDPGATTYNMTADSVDAFILKLSQSASCAVATPTVTVTDNCGSSTLTSSSTTGTYLWSNAGETTNSITVTTGATYSVTITENGCTSAAGTGTSAPKAIPATPTVTVSDNCGSSTLTSSTTSGTYLWSPNSETTNAITVTAASTFSVTVTENGCTSTAGTGTSAPIAIPATPTVTVSDACGTSTLTSSTTTGTYLWSPNSETTNAITVSTAETFSVTVTENGCESAPGTGTSAPVTVPAAPTVSTPVTYCQNSTASQLTATGTALMWYPNNTDPNGSGSGTAPTPSTTTIGQTDYYVSQTDNGCESTRAMITVDITAGTSAPTVSSPINYCQNDVAVPLTASGTSLSWYPNNTDPDGTGSSTAPTPSTGTVGTVSYFVSQTQCGEGPRAQIDVITNTIPSAPTVTVADACGSSVLTASNFTGSLTWNTTETTTSITVTSASTYSVTQTINGCVSPAGTGVSSPISLPGAPTVSSPVSYCQNATANQLTATGTGLLWYTASTGGSGSSTAPTPSTTSSGSTDHYVSQTVNTCEGPRALITVAVSATPSAPTVSSPVGYCQNATASQLTATGTGLLWYTASTGGSGNSTAPTPSTTSLGATDYFVSQTVNSCESSRASITVNISASTVAPTVTSPVSYCQNIVASPLTATGTSLLWYTAATGGTGSTTAPTPSTVNPGSYYVSQNQCGEGPRATIVVTITALPAVTVNSVTICSGNNATLTAGGATTYLWSTAETTSSITVAPTSTTTPTSYTVTGTASGCSAKAIATVTVDACIGIEENSSAHEIAVYPNPNNGAFSISISNAGSNELGISIINLLGKEVFKTSYKNNGTDFNQQMDLNDLADGIYYIRVSIGSDVKIKKIVKQ